MAKADTSRIEALDAILAEKRKHEGFLTKLEERRASTPANVFARLRDEYLTKITDLQVRASIEAESLSDGLKEDEAAVVEIEAKLAAIVEERIEGELRAEVGEYDPKEWGERLKTLNANLAKIEKERDGKVATFERTRALLGEARGPAAPAEPEAVIPVPVPPPVVAPVVAPAAAPVVAPVAAPVARPTPQAVAPAPVIRTSGVEPIHAVPVAAVVVPPVPAPSPEVVAAPVVSAAPAPAVPAAPATVAPAAAAAPVEPPTPAPRAPTPGAPMAGSPSFDELAFLNSVVGRASVPLKAEPPAPRPSRPISELRDPGASRTPAIPAAPIAVPPRAAKTAESTEEADSGPLGRPTPRTSQAIKTLKCSECGTLNYPTEWYCERCGGELAAL